MSSGSDKPVAVVEVGAGASEAATVAVGDRVEIRASLPGGTGYSWQVDPEAQGFRVASRDVVADENAFGAPGTVRFVVEALRPGPVDVGLQLQAPWEEEPAARSTVRLEVHR